MKDFPLINQPAFTQNSAFTILERPCSDLVFPYHMHPDYQLNLVVEGQGSRIIGDHNEAYTSGDLVLIGPNLPHYWTYDSEFQKQYGNGRAVILHFNQHFAGSDFIQQAAAKPIADLLNRSYRGLVFHHKTKERISEILAEIKGQSTLKQMVGLINILSELSYSTDYSYLAGTAYENKKIPEQELKIKRIINFIKMHLSDSELSLEKCASMASMSPSAFSKYFKKQTGQNYISVINEMRLSEICKKLGTSDKPIAEIAHDCGFNNISHFNKMFKKQYKITPKQFVSKINNLDKVSNKA